VIVNGHYRVDSSSQTLRCGRRINWTTSAIKDNHKFIPAKSGKKVTFSNRPLKTPGHLSKKFVTSSMPKAVVHHLEMVKINKEEPHKPRARPGEALFENLHEVRTIRKPGEFVVSGSISELLSSASLLGDIFNVVNREQNAVIFRDRNSGSGCEIGPIAPPEPLIDEIRIGHAEFKLSPMRLRRPNVIGVGDLPECSTNKFFR
jgi:hypothetical protein